MFFIDAMTFGELKEIVTFLSLKKEKGEAVVPEVSVPTHPYKIGACYLIRTVTMIDVGRLVDVTPLELVLEDAAWIADTGRFAHALRSCEFDEVEPFPDGRVIVGRGALIDAVEVPFVVRTQK